MGGGLAVGAEKVFASSSEAVAGYKGCAVAGFFVWGSERR
jgi:hypothetical protein